MASSPITSWQMDGKQWKQWQTLFSWAPKSLPMVTTAVKWKDACSLEESHDQPRQHIKKQKHYFADKSLYSQSYVFSSSHVRMWELGHKEGWAPQNWCFWTVVLQKTLENPLNCKEIKPVNPKGNQSWIFMEGLMLKLKLQYFSHLLWGAWLIRKDPDAGKDWMQDEKGLTEDEIVGWHHWFNGHEFEQAPGNGRLPGKSGVLQFMGLQSLTWLSNWTPPPQS